jgi:hypothetical protein
MFYDRYVKMGNITVGKGTRRWRIKTLN